MMSYKFHLPILLCLVLLSGLLSACVSGGVLEVGVEPTSPPGAEGQPTAIAGQGTSSPIQTPTPELPANRQAYDQEFFGFHFVFPTEWFGPDEYVVDNVLRVAIGSDVVYPYGTDRTEQIYTVKNAYYITLQYTINNHLTEPLDVLQSLNALQDGESISTARSLVTRVGAVRLGGFEGVEYISTLSETAQTEPVYGREVILVNQQGDLLTISGSPNNVEIGGDWRAAYKAVDEANQALFHEIVESISFTERDFTAPGTVRGSLCFPSEVVPAMNVYFLNLISDEITELTTAENQNTFEITLQTGPYYAYAYLVSDPTMGGAYTNASACGLGETCTDHTMLGFEVLPGQTKDNVQICDFYAPEFIPTNPKAVESADPAAAGLIYRWVLGQFLVDDAGSAHMLAAMQSMPSYSPDGTQAVFARNDDIWVIDFATHEVRNLTNTPDRIERDPQWWPANPEVVIFGSATLAQGYDIMSGHLSMVRMDGSDYTVLSPDFIGNTAPSLSPNGKMIAHDNGAYLWLYNLENNTNDQVNLESYGLAEVQQLGSQSWSPDGTKLALWVGGPFDSGNWAVSLAVIDFANGTSSRLHTFVPIGSGGWIPTSRWSPDGQWLTATSRGENDRGALLLIRVDGTDEIDLGPAGESVWSPDGRLAYFEWGGDFLSSKVYIVRPGEQAQQLALKPGSVPVLWTNK